MVLTREFPCFSSLFVFVSLHVFIFYDLQCKWSDFWSYSTLLQGSSALCDLPLISEQISSIPVMFSTSVPLLTTQWSVVYSLCHHAVSVCHIFFSPGIKQGFFARVCTCLWFWGEKKHVLHHVSNRCFSSSVMDHSSGSHRHILSEHELSCNYDVSFFDAFSQVPLVVTPHYVFFTALRP